MACSEPVIDPAMGWQRTYHCQSGKLAADSPLPEKCWQRRFPVVGPDALEILRPAACGGTANREHIAAKVTIVESLASAVEQGQNDGMALKELEAQFGAHFVGKICAIVPEESSLHKAVKTFQMNRRREMRDKGLPNSGRKPRVPIVLSSPEFIESIKQWDEACHTRAERRAKCGSPYNKVSLMHLKAEPRRFCAYLEREDATRWVDVAQRHLDGYIEATNRYAAQKIFAFLRFIMRRFRIKTTFKRPRNEPLKLSHRVIPSDEFEQLLSKAASLPDTDVALAISFVGIYAQTLVATNALRIDAVQHTADGFLVKFNEAWVPMDDWTCSLIEKYLKQRTKILEEAPGDHDSSLLILSKKWYLEYKIASLTNRKLIDIRLTALLNILQTGFRDRRALQASLGVSQQTIINIESLCGWDFQQTVSDEAAALRRDLIDGKLTDR
jgi:hypothetical protein